MKNRILPVFISFSGCRQRCVYCNQNSITGQSNTDILTSAVEQIKTYLNVSNNWTEIAFYGGSFTCLPVSIQQKLYDMAHETGIKDIRFSTSPDCVTDELLVLAAENGVTTVEIGVQSLNDVVLRMNNRPCDAEHTLQAVKTAKKYIKNTGVQIMTGMYGETFDNFADTVDKITELTPEYVRIYPCIVLKETELEKIYSSGGFKPLTLAESVARSAYAMILLESAGISVIRIGLQDADQMKESIAAGEYHPATGDMAKTIAVAIYLALGHNIAIDRRFLSAVYGYAGYNRDASQDRLIMEDDRQLCMRDVCKAITENISEDYKRNIQRETARHAERLIDKTINR